MFAFFFFFSLENEIKFYKQHVLNVFYYFLFTVRFKYQTSSNGQNQTIPTLELLFPLLELAASPNLPPLSLYFCCTKSMATIIKTPPFHAPPTLLPSPSAKSTKAFCLSFRQQHRSTTATTRVFSRTAHLCFSAIPSLRLVKFAPLASSGETETTQTEEEIEEPEVVVFFFFSTDFYFSFSI